jgi:hypothetical protein
MFGPDTDGLPTRDEVASLLETRLVGNPAIVSPGSRVQWIASLGLADGAFRATCEMRDTEWIEQRGESTALGSVNVAVESDALDWDDWHAADGTGSQETGARMIGGEPVTFDDYMGLAWEAHVRDRVSRWADDILEQARAERG